MRGGTKGGEYMILWILKAAGLMVVTYAQFAADLVKLVVVH